MSEFRKRRESDLDAEIQFHLEQRIRDLMKTGVAEEEAYRIARIEFGGMDAIKEDCRDAGRSIRFGSLFRNVRYSFRTLLRDPGFALVAILALALGIGSTTAIFTLMDAVMYRPLPVSEPSRLFRVGDGDDTIAEGRHGRWGFFSFPLYERLKAGTPEFKDITAFGLTNPLSVRRQGTSEPATALRAEYVTGTYFSTLGVGAFRGRVFAADDDRPSATPVVVLSYRVWQEVYGGDSSLVGSSVVVQGHPFTVIGVAPPEFFGETVRPFPPDVWIPLQQEPMIAGSGSLLHQSTASWLAVIGRLRPDASIAGIDFRLTKILRTWIQYESTYPSNRMPDILRELPNQMIQVVPAGAGIGFGGLAVKEQYGSSLRSLLLICALVLVIACANVANLTLARSVTRRAQTAVRLAIGATLPQIIAEAVTESVLLAIAGGVAGVGVAMTAARFLVAIAFENSDSVPIPTTPSLAVLAIAAGLSLVTGVVCGVVPAWSSTRTNPIDAMRGSTRSTGRESFRARATLLIVQATLSVVVIAGSAMLARSLANLEQQDFGYRVEDRVLIGLSRLPATYTPERLSSLYRDIEQRLTRLAGVRGAGLALYNPLTGSWTATIQVSGHPPNPSNEATALRDGVSADYLQNLGVRLVRGRLFTAADNETNAPVAVVNESFVTRFFEDNEDPLDQHFGIDRPGNAGTFRIVGIVGDAKFAWYEGLTRPARPMFFVPLAQRVDLIQGIMLVTNSPPGELEPVLRRTLTAADPNLTITNVTTMRQQIDRVLNRERAVARLADLFGIVALVLAAVGIYGVTAYMVAQQTNEIGIRVALGADRTNVIRLVLRETFQRVAIGLVLGLPLAIATARFMAAQLYGVSYWDPFAMSVAAISLAAVACIAAIIPARRAAAMTPMSALRSE